jgi:PAS domain S-box-containing protein
VDLIAPHDVSDRAPAGPRRRPTLTAYMGVVIVVFITVTALGVVYERATGPDDRALGWHSLLVALVVFVVMIAAAFAVSRRIASSITALSEQVRMQVANGPRQPLPVSGPREVARVAESFNELADALHNELDVTARAVEALRTSEARKSAILASALDAIITMDHEGRIDRFNPAAERTFGYASIDVLGRKLADVIIPPGQRDAHERGLEWYLATGEGPLLGRRGEMTAMRADGTLFPAEVTINAVDAPGPPLFTGFIRDITEQKAAEAERASLEDRLHQSQRLESLGELAGGIAHDFNNLLAVILNYASFVAEAVPDDAEVQYDVQQILSASERATRLTQQLLMFARREPVRPEVLDLNGVVDDIEDLLSHSIGENVELVVHAGSEARAVADRGQTEQVLMNLAVNARDAMPEGGTLTIATEAADLDQDFARLHPRLAAGRYICLSVSDTGTGMSREVAARAFDPFFTTKAKTGGSGLGLATVYGIVSEAGGDVILHSEEGLGTAVQMYFPAAVDPAAATSGGVPPALIRGAGETVLVVEDQDAVREVTVRILRRNGYVVLEAASGADAIAAAAGADIDLLVTDVVMPNMSGRELAEHLRGQRAELPVLFMSGYAQGVLGSQHAVDDGAALIQKPFNEITILQVVHETIAASRGVQTAGT